MRSNSFKTALAILALGATTAVLLGLAPAKPRAEDGWSISFIPVKGSEAEAVSVIINGQCWIRRPDGEGMGTTYENKEGRMDVPLPAKWAQSKTLHIVAVSKPWGKESEIHVKWKGENKQKMTFSKEEDHEIKR